MGGCRRPSGRKSSPSACQLFHHLSQENPSTGSMITAFPSRRMETPFWPSKQNSSGRRRPWLRPFLMTFTIFIARISWWKTTVRHAGHYVNPVSAARNTPRAFGRGILPGPRHSALRERPAAQRILRRVRAAGGKGVRGRQPAHEEIHEEEDRVADVDLPVVDGVQGLET
jgi:hypothetical protein